MRVVDRWSLNSNVSHEVKAHKDVDFFPFPDREHGICMYRTFYKYLNRP
jgi:hypothetical protein